MIPRNQSISHFNHIPSFGEKLVYFKSKMNKSLPHEILNQIPNKGPLLGTQSSADLRLSTHVTGSLPGYFVYNFT